MILAGGAASRMGRDKAAQLWAGVRAIDRVAGVARQAGCQPVISVGTADYGLPLALDETPLAGPVGGVMVGAAMLREAGCTRALVLAVDAPTLRLADIEPLLSAAEGAAFQTLHFPAVVRLDALPADAPAGLPMRVLWEQAGVQRLPAPQPEVLARLRGANTPEEMAALLADL